MSGAQIQTSHPGMDAWRPHGDRVSWADAGWLGAAWALAIHATLHFFSAAITELEALLVVFMPPERIAFALTTQTAPLARWALLLVVVAFYGALIGWGILAATLEVAALWRSRRHRAAQGAGTDPA